MLFSNPIQHDYSTSILSSTSGKRYCHMLVKEGVDDVLRNLVMLPDSNASVQELAKRVVDVLQENGFTKNL